MGDQEMQFADPAWRPPSQGSAETNPQQREPYTPKPVNNDTLEQAQQQEEPFAYTASYTGGYRAQPGAAMPSISSIPLRTRQRRGRSPWLWIVLALVIFSLAGGAFGRNNEGFGHFSKDMFPHSQAFTNAQYFPVTAQSTIEIINFIGAITVHTGGSGDKVAIQTDQPGTKLVDTGSGDTLNIAVNSPDPSAEVNLDVTVSNEANLVLKTDSGDITVDGVNGQVNLTSDSGGVNLSQVSLSGNSALITNSGDINFAGTLDPNGAYQLQSQSGSVDVTLPPGASFHADITTNNSGLIESDFPELNPPSPDATTVHGDVGSAPLAKVTIKTDSGSISLHKGES